MSRFMYHAHGLALAGSITQPFTADIDGQAATSLASVGGHSSSKNDSYNLNDIITYETANCYVSGTQTAAGYHTATTCVIKGLNILHTIKADEIVGKLSSLHTETNGKPNPAQITALGSHFVNLQIAGQPVDVEMDKTQFAQTTYLALSTYWSAKPAAALRSEWDATSTVVPPGLTMRAVPGQGPTKLKKTFNATLVQAVQPTGSVSAAKELPYGYAIHVPHFGNIYLCEVLVEEDCHRLSMLRLELGCPYVGGATVVEAVANGIWP